MTEATTSAESTIITWWIILSSIAVLNIGLISYAYIVLKRKKSDWKAELFSFRKIQFYMSALYVAGCAFRSFFPRGDVHRVVLYDGYVSAVVIGRSVATIAEIAFVVQWAWLLKEMARFTGDKRLNYIEIGRAHV